MDCSNHTGERRTVSVYLAWSGTTLTSLLFALNLIVLIVIFTSIIKSKTVSIPKLIVLGIASTDFGYAVLSAIPQVFRFWWGYCAAGGRASCTLQGVADNLFSVSSLLIVLLASVERFCAIRLPFRYPQLFTVRRVLAMLAVVLLVSFMMASMPLMGVNSYAFNVFCDFNWADRTLDGSTFVYIKTIGGLFLMLVQLCINIAVITAVLKMRNVSSVQPSDVANQQPKASSQERRFVVLISLVTATFIICHAPFLVRMLQYQIGVADPKTLIPNDTSIKRMYLSNSIVNPSMCLIFYASGSKRVHLAWNRLRALCGLAEQHQEIYQSQQTKETENV